MNPREIKYHVDKLGIDNKGKILVYKYIDFSGAVALLSDKCFKFSHSQDFNDPFDLYDELIDFKKFEPLRFDNLTREQKRNIKKTPLKRLEEKLKIEWKKHRINFGISCFSKTYDNILMWSHYADKHQGVCIGLEVDANKLLDDDFITFAVEYEDTFVPVPYFDKDEKKRADVIMRYLSTKASFWDYEQEIRIVNFDFFKKYNSQFLNFEKYAELKIVLMGLKMKIDNKTKLNKIVKKQKNISIHEMKTVSNKFGLMK